MNKALENKSFFLFFFFSSFFFLSFFLFLSLSLSLFSNYYFNVFHPLEKGLRNHLKHSELTMIYKQPKVKLGLRVLWTAKIQSKCSTSFTLSVTDCPSVSGVLTTLAPSEVPLIALISTATTGPQGWGFKSKK